MLGKKKKEERKKINFQFQNQASAQQDPLAQVASLLPSPLSPVLAMDVQSALLPPC